MSLLMFGKFSTRREATGFSRWGVFRSRTFSPRDERITCGQGSRLCLPTGGGMQVSDFGLTEEQLAECEAILSYRFQSRELLSMCLTHASGAKHRLESNERLEFLGDSILGLIVCEMLYRRFPEFTEGDLTRIKSILVSRSTCAKISLQLGCERFLLVGKGLMTSERIPESVIAAVFEALIAGLYLDGGLEAARKFVERVMDPELDLATQIEHGRNFKSLLQQMSQKNFGETPAYKLLDERGPDHSKWFKVAAAIGGQWYSPAWGANKKEAEQRAAHNALFELEGKEIPHAAEDHAPPAPSRDPER